MENHLLSQVTEVVIHGGGGWALWNGPIHAIYAQISRDEAWKQGWLLSVKL